MGASMLRPLLPDDRDLPLAWLRRKTSIRPSPVDPARAPLSLDFARDPNPRNGRVRDARFQRWWCSPACVAFCFVFAASPSSSTRKESSPGAVSRRRRVFSPSGSDELRRRIRGFLDLPSPLHRSSRAKGELPLLPMPLPQPRASW